MPNLMSESPQMLNTKVRGGNGRSRCSAPDKVDMVMLASRAPAGKSCQNGWDVTQPLSRCI
eukprot:4286555-Heterocapsa_arctica.AAC.1